MLENTFLQGVVLFLAVIGAGSCIFTTWFLLVVIRLLCSNMRTRARLLGKEEVGKNER